MCESSNEDPVTEYYNFGPPRIFEAYYCKTYTQPIFANDLSIKVVQDAITSCLPSNLFCQLNSITFY